MKPLIISPSILAADFAKLGEEIKTVIHAGADWIHFDVMDNHYVPNLSFGPIVCQAIKPYSANVPIDIHLMVSPVDNLISAFSAAQANIITFHPEATLHIDRSLNLIKGYGLKAGLAFNPATPLGYLDHILDKLDVILLMSVNPGFGGQEFIPSTLSKIEKVRSIIDKSGLEIILEVDGGITPDNILSIYNAGADAIVTGSAIFGSNDYMKTITQFRDSVKYCTVPVLLHTIE